MKVNKPIFGIGIVLVLIAAILVIGNLMGVSTFPAILGTILGILGILLLGASVYSPLRQIKVNKPMFAAA
jgi:membrane-bound ClpP family serine protease